MTTSVAHSERSATRSKGRPNLKEAAAINRAIRDAAIKALLQHGEAATLNAVALGAGLSRKSVYARYSSKSEMFLDVLRGLLESAEDVEFDTAGPVEERLFNYIRAALNRIATPESRAIQRLLTADPAYIAALRPDMLKATHRHFFVPLRGLLEEAQSKGELVTTDIDSTTSVLIKLIFAEGMTPETNERNWLSSHTPEDYARFVTNLMTRGLLPRDKS